jgi:hypothetical protein
LTVFSDVQDLKEWRGHVDEKLVNMDKKLVNMDKKLVNMDKKIGKLMISCMYDWCMVYILTP